MCCDDEYFRSTDFDVSRCREQAVEIGSSECIFSDSITKGLYSTLERVKEVKLWRLEDM